MLIKREGNQRLWNWFPSKLKRTQNFPFIGKNFTKITRSIIKAGILSKVTRTSGQKKKFPIWKSVSDGKVISHIKASFSLTVEKIARKSRTRSMRLKTLWSCVMKVFKLLRSHEIFNYLPHICRIFKLKTNSWNWRGQKF